ncbi:hypothetical protein WJX74_009640 [Apatococcus lobatus]|uniref:ER membrane protein complex subunit 6 n=1 Tax=Apatococcus lobatus TaxID=904363 RepID=A0AAW1QPE1_9CHLO
MEQQGTPPLRLSEALISQSRLRQNVGIVGYVRIFASLAAGLMAGVLGITGWIGFAFFLVLELLTIPPLLLKAEMSPTKFLKPGTHCACVSASASPSFDFLSRPGMELELPATSVSRGP